jgi:hypothetical protein
MSAGVALALLLAAQPIECPFAEQKPMLIIRLFFGQDGGAERHVTDGEWRDFLAHIVTPRFPDGFTVYDGAGQWGEQNSPKIVREQTKIMEIATDDTPIHRREIEEISNIYRETFHQQSVGIITIPGCGAF